MHVHMSERRGRPGIRTCETNEEPRRALTVKHHLPDPLLPSHSHPEIPLVRNLPPGCLILRALHLDFGRDEGADDSGSVMPGDGMKE